MLAKVSAILALYVTCLGAQTPGSGRYRLVSASPEVPTPREDLAWARDFANARRRAQATGQPILLYFAASWSERCAQLERDIRKYERLKKRVGELASLRVDIDDPAGLALVRRFRRLSTVPEIVILDASAKVLHRAAGNDAMWAALDGLTPEAQGDNRTSERWRAQRLWCRFLAEHASGKGGGDATVQTISDLADGPSLQCHQRAAEILAGQRPLSPVVAQLLVPDPRYSLVGMTRSLLDVNPAPYAPRTGDVWARHCSTWRQDHIQARNTLALLAARAAAHLRRALTDPRRESARAAASTLAALHLPDTAGFLVRAFHRSRPRSQLRATLLACMQECDDHRVLRTLIRCAGDAEEHPDYRAEAIESIRGFIAERPSGDEHLAAVLARGAVHPRLALRSEALRTMRFARAQVPLAPLLRCLDDARPLRPTAPLRVADQAMLEFLRLTGQKVLDTQHLERAWWRTSVDPELRTMLRAWFQRHRNRLRWQVEAGRYRFEALGTR